MDGLVSSIARVASRRPRSVLLLVALATVPIAFIAAQLSVSTSRTALVSEEDPGWRRYQDLANEFGIPEDLIVVVKGDSPDAVRSYLDAIAGRLAESDRIKSLFHRVDLRVFQERAPLYFDDAVLDLLERLAAMDSVAAVVDAPDPASRIAALADVMAELPEPSDPRLDDALRRLLLEMERFAKNEGAKEVELIDQRAILSSALAERAEGGIDAYGYLTTDGGRTGVMFVRPHYTRDEMSVVKPFVAAVRSACEAAREGRGDVRFGLTGIPASEVDELTTIEQDTVLTTVVALAGVVLLFLIYFPTLRLLSISLAPLGFGAIWTAAFIRIAFGHVNLMSSLFLLILIGIGIDSSIHIAARFLELRRTGLGSERAAHGAVELAGRGVLVSGVTSAGAFAAVAWCGFRGIEELGVAAAVGLLLTLAFSLLLLPAILSLFGPRIAHARQGFPGLPAVVRAVVRRPGVVLAAAIAMSIASGYGANRTPFDFSLLSLLPENAESARLMAELVDERDLSNDAVVAIADSIEQARELEAAFERLPSVHRAVSAAAFLPAEQERKLDRVRRIAAVLRESRARVRSKPATAPSLEEALARLDLASLARYETARDGLSRFHESLGRVLSDLAGRLDRVRPLSAADLPLELQSRFVSERGRYAIYAVPKRSIWDREALATFIEEARSVDPHVTGFAETFYENSGRIRTGFVNAAVHASIAVFFLLLIDLRRLRYVIFAGLPVACGALWMLGSMELLGLSYNLANIVGLPLIIGVGVDHGVHLLHRYLQDRKLVDAGIRTGGPVMLSALTTMAGFGSLALASHRGYSSLGGILFLGVGACTLSAMTVLPAALAWFEEDDP